MSSAQKKPGIGKTELSLAWAERLQAVVEIMAGRRGRSADLMAVTAAKTAAASPTTAEFNKVVDDLNAMKKRFNDLLNQVQD